MDGIRKKSHKVNYISYFYLAAVLMVLLFLVCGIRAARYSFGFNTHNVTQLSDGWSYHADKEPAQPITLPQTRNVPDAKEITITRKLPGTIQNGTTLAVYSSFQSVKVSIDGRNALTYNGAKGLLWTDVPETQILFLQLRSQDAGKELSVTFASPLAFRKGVMHKILMGDKTDIIYYLVNERIVIMLIGMLLMVIGVVIVSYKAFSQIRGIIGQVLQYQGIYMLLIGVFFVLQAGMNQLFFQNLNWSRFVEFFSIMMVPLAYFFEVDAAEEHYFGKLTDVLAITCLSLCCLELFLAVFCHIDYMKVIVITYLMFGITILFTVFSALYIALKNKQLFRQMRWMIYAYLGLAFSAVGEILMYYFDPEREDCRVLACGVLIHFGCTMQWIMQQNNRIETEKERSLQQADAKSAFLASMSHEIRTPVSTILGINEMLIRQTQDAEIKSYAEDMNESGKKLLTLINNILDYSKIESGQMEVTEMDYELLPLLQDLSAEMQEVIAPGVVFDMQVAPQLPSGLHGDKSKLRIILWNILQNAAAFTTEGRIAMTVIGNIEKEGKIKLVISIKDTGVGMSQELQRKVFESFQHTTDSTTQTIGLGLTIAGNLARKIGAVIEVRSTEKKGSEFTVRLMQNITDMIPVGIYHDKKQEIITDFKAPGVRILVVDDEIISMKMIEGILRDTQIKIDYAQNGQEALERLARKKYHVVFMDHLMPDINGDELFKEVRARRIPLNLDTPVVMISAGTGTDTREKYLAMGFEDFLIKPINEKVLKKIIYRLLPEQLKETEAKNEKNK